MWPFGRRTRDDIGRRGERLARGHLKRRGLKILATNYRCPRGEVDLIALDRSTRRETGAETLCFVEVKTRTSDAYTSPEAAVNPDKQRRIRKVADYYRLSRVATEGLNLRFDIVAVVLRPDAEPSVRHLPDAFR
ncbi:MAG: YraN family protein [Phycisphaerae bacterium]|nr:YraN family protein [Phycisphaerae bacterium]